MKIEKISDTQVRFYLTNEDLNERNIKLSELAFGSEKAQALFREITEEAANTCGFTLGKEGESIPLMVEAMPSSDGIIIVVSKVNDMNDIQTHIENRLSKSGKNSEFGLAPASLTERRFKTKMPDLETYAPPADDENISIYGFETLETASRAMRAVSNAFCSYSDSKLYRCDDKYYIFVRPADITNMERDAFDSIINQFGEKHRSNTIARAYIAEHGEIMIKNNAVNLLATL